MPKRDDYLSWDEYFMGVAFLSGMRSKDPSTQVGACIIDKEKKIIGMGYNGFPLGSSDDEMPWENWRFFRHKISVCCSRRIKRNFKQHKIFERKHNLCDTFPMQ